MKQEPLRKSTENGRPPGRARSLGCARWPMAYGCGARCRRL